MVELAPASGTQVHLTSAIKKAARFLADCFDPLVGWSDFQTTHSGMSTSWVTAYVLLTAGHVLPQGIRQRAVNLLLDQRKEDGCWGYSDTTPSDCDSTIHVGLALNHYIDHQELVRSDILPRISRYAKIFDGLSTYADPSILAAYRQDSFLTSYTGWVASHPCVSALALRLLTQTHPGNNRLVGKLATYLTMLHSNTGWFPSYWWESDVYTASCLASCEPIACSLVCQLHSSAIQYLRERIIRQNGLLEGIVSKSPCPLETSRAVSPLVHVLPNHILRNSTAFILDTQDSSGFWQSSPSLRIPPPNEVDPYNKSVCLPGILGVGSITKDQKNIYTTSTVLNLLCQLTPSW